MAKTIHVFIFDQALWGSHTQGSIIENLDLKPSSRWRFVNYEAEVNAQGYADDVAILVKSKFLNVAKELTERALGLTEKWCRLNSLFVNPDNTSHAIFAIGVMWDLHSLEKHCGYTEKSDI
ncbi:hypothetical protein Zmor_013822 [Zophobas morio]|uniref:Uncharacterized protein n=1 Tax=Zophobas morio TaxID=2755281 RepID=A0AA38IG53_9CUCU|nr:hypothetical protein Zmor_013822 [Zophobas morio]